MANQQRHEELAAFGFLSPALGFYLLFVAAPLVAAVAFSFFFIDRLSFSFRFAGLDNFGFVYSDPRFWKTFRNTFYFISLAVIGNVGGGLILAVLLNRNLPRFVLYIFRLAYFFPVLVATAFISFIWKFLFANDLGIINYYLRELGLPAVPWLSAAGVAMISVVIMDVWKHVGFFMIILLAALQGVPRDLIEAATIDGASEKRIFFKITVPYIAPVILFCVAYATIGGLQVFDSVRILTNGGPGDATRTVVLYMFDEAFGVGDLSTGTVAALTLLVVISIVVALQMFISRRWILR
jgi:multiple sugar transport system permease protein